MAPWTNPYATYNATDKQVDCLRKLCRQGWLSRGDFPSDRKYRRKRELGRDMASSLIALGIDRRKESRWSRRARRMSRNWALDC